MEPALASATHGWVESVEVAPSGLGSEPRTTAVLRDDRGLRHSVSILGGPTPRGGWARLAGYVVPVVGARVRLDLREERPAASPLAWVSAGAVWPPAAQPVTLLSRLDSPAFLSGHAPVEIDLAARAWSTIPCTGLRLRYGGASTSPPGDDGASVVYVHEIAWPPALTAGALAQTVLHTDAQGGLRDADVHVNAVDWVFSEDGAKGRPDFRSIVTHELGHAIGLAHSTDPAATMWASYGGGLAWRSLEADDRAGACALYPGQGAPGCPADPCPAGTVCADGRCVRRGALGDVCAPCERVPGACEAAGDDARCTDLPQGGRVCTRACPMDAACGAGATCMATTSSGDFQCVPDDGCASGPNACAGPADCATGTCRGGACVGPAEAPADAGADADAGAAPPLLSSGCACEASGGGPTARRGWILALTVALLARGRRARQARASAPASARGGFFA
jgi:hypothetical protein